MSSNFVLFQSCFDYYRTFAVLLYMNFRLIFSIATEKPAGIKNWSWRRRGSRRRAGKSGKSLSSPSEALAWWTSESLREICWEELQRRLVSRSVKGCDLVLAVACEFAVRHIVVGCCWSLGWADEKSWKGQKRVQIGEDRLTPARISNHDDLQHNGCCFTSLSKSCASFSFGSI